MTIGAQLVERKFSAFSGQVYSYGDVDETKANTSFPRFRSQTDFPANRWSFVFISAIEGKLGALAMDLVM
jgi:hypothetical protein